MSDEENEGRRLDAYESKYMSSEGVLLHERRRMPGWFFALLGVVGLVELGASVAAMNPLPALIALPFIALLGLLLSHLRVLLTRDHLHIQFGLWGPKVALEDIVEMRVEPYSMMRYGGYGIRRGFNGYWAYSTPGGNGQALLIDARDGRGGLRKLCITLDQAEEFKRRIEELQGATRVRVEAAEAPEAEGDEHEVVAAQEDRAKRG